MHCTRCAGTGFINIEHFPDCIRELDDMHDEAVKFLATDHDTDASVCNCCGDGEDWYGEPGQHYGPDDPSGSNGPYACNGGLAKCH